MVVILKLGGSVITRKEEPETLDRDSLEACTRAIGATDEDLLLIHGAGSYGHYHAEQYGVTVTDGTRDPEAVFTIHDSMRRLNDTVVGSLHDHGVPAVGVHPLSVAHRDETGELVIPADQVSAVLRAGFVPVLFGDVIAHAADGFTVVSGDEIAVTLTEALDVDRVGMCSSVPGVLDADDEVIDHLGSLADAADALGGSHGWDVTGGMAEKVRELLRLPVPAAIFGLDALPAFLAGEDVGTRIDGAAAAADGPEDRD